MMILAGLCAMVGAKPLFEQVDLFRQGDGITHTYRIPAMAVTKNGVIVAVVDARRDSWRDLPGNIDLVMRRSKDLGKTWEPMRVVQDFPEGHGAGDPSLLLDRETGRLFLFYSFSPPGVGHRASRVGTNDPKDMKTVHAHVIHSDDDGETWSSATPVDLNPQIKDKTWAAATATSGRGLQTRSGRLIQVYFVRNGEGKGMAAVAYSDDHGASWKPGGTVERGGETKAFERTNGDVVLNSRVSGSGYRWRAVSRDGGLHFGPLQPDYGLPDPGCNGDVLRVSPKVVLSSNAGVLNTRVRMTVRASYDDGVTWPVSRVAHAGPSGYSSMALLPDGTVGLFYERGNRDRERDMSTRETLTFARFNLDWLTEKIPVLTEAGTPNPRFDAIWAWLDAGSLGSEDAAAVKQWADSAPGGIRNLLHASGAAPVLALRAANGKAAVRFEAGQWLAAQAVAWNEFRNLPNGFTMFVVGRVLGDGFLFDHMPDVPGIGLAVESGGGKRRWMVHVNRPAPDAVSESKASAEARTGFAVHMVVLAGNRVEHAVNGRTGASFAVRDAGVPLYQGSLRLNSDAAGGRSGGSEIAEILVYARTLDEGERRAVRRYLERKYQLAE